MLIHFFINEIFLANKVNSNHENTTPLSIFNWVKIALCQPLNEFVNFTLDAMKKTIDTLDAFVESFVCLKMSFYL